MAFFLITGLAIIIHSCLVTKFLRSGYKVIGIDDIKSYYYKNLKLKRCVDNNFYF